MGQAVTLALLIAVGLVALFRPWVGVVGAYFVALLVPQNIWWWNFQGLRPSFMILLPTMIGIAFAFFQGRIDLSTLKNKRTFYLLVLWAGFALSYHLGPYVNLESELRPFDAGWLMSLVNNIFILYFLACLCIDRPMRIRVLAIAVVVSSVYLIYWANSMYLSGQAWGRLAGPSGRGGSGVYSDENNFAMFFVCTLPFVWHFGATFKNVFIRCGIWAIVPLGWHAIFLTGSRGGLVGVGATLLVSVFRSKRKLLSLLLIPAFVIAFLWQGGDVMQNRAGTISEYDMDRSATGRIEAWSAATSMVQRHPVTGVGLSSFVPAFPYFSDDSPREAHNTFFQIAGESGFLSGLMYLLIVYACLVSLWRNHKRIPRLPEGPDRDTLFWVNEAALVGYVGLFVCSLFLSLHVFEIFYLMCALVNALLFSIVAIEDSTRSNAGQNANVRPVSHSQVS